MLASGLPQSNRISNHTYYLPAHIEVLTRLIILFLVPSPVLVRDDTLRKNLQNDTNGLVQKPVIVFSPNKEIISSHNWPKALESFQTFQPIPRFFYVVLGHPILSSLVFNFHHSKLTLRIQFKQFTFISFKVSKVLSHVV